MSEETAGAGWLGHPDRTAKSTVMFYFEMHHLIIFEAILLDHIFLRLILKLFPSSEQMPRGESGQTSGGAFAWGSCPRIPVAFAGQLIAALPVGVSVTCSILTGTEAPIGPLGALLPAHHT